MALCYYPGFSESKSDVIFNHQYMLLLLAWISMLNFKFSFDSGSEKVYVFERIGKLWLFILFFFLFFFFAFLQCLVIITGSGNLFFFTFVPLEISLCSLQIICISYPDGRASHYLASITCCRT